MANFTPNQNDYNNMTPFKTWLKYQINTWGLNSFPFVESDFDDLTNYAMMMKLMKHFNVLIENQNMVEEDMTKLYNAFTELQTYLFNEFADYKNEVDGEIEQFETSITNDFNDLQNYVDNFFDTNLPQMVSDKLDEMASDGTLESIIQNYITDTMFRTYNTLNDLKNSNLDAGLKAITFGYYSINDGGGAKYYITDTTPTSYYETLTNGKYAVLVIDNPCIKQFGAKGDGITNDTNAFQNAINYSKNLNNESININLNAGEYLITSTITMPLNVKLHTLGCVLIKYTGTNELFKLIPPENIQELVNNWDVGQNVFNIGNVLDGSKGSLTLQGTGKENQQIGLKIGGDTLGVNWLSGTFWANFNNFCIEKFGVGVQYTNKQVCMHKFYNMVITYCGKAISDINELENSGEMIHYNCCSFNNNDLFLEINHPVNHNFDNCNIDYNGQGVQINYVGGYYQLTISNSWLEGNSTPSDSLPFIQAPSRYNDDAINVVITNSYLYPRGFVEKYMFRGNMYLNFNNICVLENRYTANGNYTNYPESEFLCDDYVKVFNRDSIHYMSAPCLTAPSSLINKTDYNFENATNEAVDSAPGFEFPSISGDVDAVVTNERSFTGTKSIKILGTGNDYKTIRTIELPVFKFKRIYANAVVYVPDNNNNSNTFACTFRVDFFDKDGTNISHLNQDYTGMSVPLDKCNKWMCLPMGLSINERSAIIPDNCYTAKVSVQFGNLKTNIWVDNIGVECW